MLHLDKQNKLDKNPDNESVYHFQLFRKTYTFQELKDKIKELIADPKKLCSILTSAFENGFNRLEKDADLGTLWHKLISSFDKNSHAVIEHYEPIFKLLKEVPASLANRSGVTPFHLAVQLGNVELAARLYKEEIDANCQTKSGFTALHFAVMNQDEKMIHYLINTIKVTMSLRDNRSRSPMDILSDKQEKVLQVEPISIETLLSLENIKNIFIESGYYDDSLTLSADGYYRNGSIEARYSSDLKKYLRTFQDKPTNKDSFDDEFSSDINFDWTEKYQCLGTRSKIPNIPVFLNGRLYDFDILGSLLYIRTNLETAIMLDPIDKREITWGDITPALGVQLSILMEITKQLDEKKATRDMRKMNV